MKRILAITIVFLVLVFGIIMASLTTAQEKKNRRSTINSTKRKMPVSLY